MKTSCDALLRKLFCGRMLHNKPLPLLYDGLEILALKLKKKFRILPHTLIDKTAIIQPVVRIFGEKKRRARYLT